MRSMQWQLGIFGTISAFAFRHRETSSDHRVISCYFKIHFLLLSFLFVCQYHVPFLSTYPATKMLYTRQRIQRFCKFKFSHFLLILNYFSPFRQFFVSSVPSLSLPFPSSVIYLFYNWLSNSICARQSRSCRYCQLICQPSSVLFISQTCCPDSRSCASYKLPCRNFTKLRQSEFIVQFRTIW